MIDGVSLRDPVLINTAGHSAGVLLFGLVIVLVLNSWKRSSNRQRLLSTLAAVLAFLWNLGSLVVLSSLHSPAAVSEWLVAFSFSVLSLLPAILFHLVLKGRAPVFVSVGYLLSFASVALHIAELRWPIAVLHLSALLLISAGFSTLLAGSVLSEVVRRRRSDLVVDLVCLFLFTLSFFHFGFGHTELVWANEITWHHTSIPLILIVILRDYRFLLLEAVTRFTANFTLASLYALTLFELNRIFHLLNWAKDNPYTTGLLIVTFCLSLILFAYSRTFLEKRITQTLFRRSDFHLHLQHILSFASEARTERELLDKASEEFVQLVRAERVAVVWNEARALKDRLDVNPEALSTHEWAEVQLRLRFSRGDAAVILLSSRYGSRRYSSEDLHALNQLATLLTEQVERLRGDELQRLAHQAELRALQSQINPHFLFNALNTLYGTIGRESFEARRMVLNLADIFRYFLQPGHALIPLKEELKIVRAYLEIEQLRLGERLHVQLDVHPAAQPVAIPILSIQPLVENAIKHGISNIEGIGKLSIAITASDDRVHVSINDNGPGFVMAASSAGSGVGLGNVRQRLQLHYGAESDLKIRSVDGQTSVAFSIPILPDQTVSSSVVINARA